MLDASIRDQLAASIVRRLGAAAPGSSARLRGSLAGRNADRYSDIDVEWNVPAGAFDRALGNLRQTLEPIGRVESLRLDPDQGEAGVKAVISVQFSNLPLFWRLDIEMVALPPGAGEAAPSRTAPVSMDFATPAQSAMTSVVAAIKAVARKDEPTAQELIAKGYDRIGLRAPGRPVWSAITELTDKIAATYPNTAPFARRVLALVDEMKHE
jgi:hypothetical protein